MRTKRWSCSTAALALTSVVLPQFLPAEALSATVAEQILSLTGSKRTKLVWVRGGSREKIIGFDTNTGSERLIRGSIGEGGAVRPLLTSDGSKVVYSTGGDVQDFGTRHRVYVMNWDGTGSPQKLTDDGYLASIWTDPSSGTEYAISMRMNRRTYDRIPLNPVGPLQTFWTGPSGCRAELQFSADGDRACLASDGVGWVDFAASPPVYHKTGSGCRPSMAPDNSYLWWHFNGPHDGVVMHPTSGGTWSVSIPNSQSEAYYPRWTNKKGFMTHTNNFNGGSSAEVFFCKFASDYRSIATSVKVTSNSVREYHPYARIFDTSPPPSVRIDSFTASPQSVTAGDPSTLAWTTSNATSVSISGGVGTVSADGSTQVTPSQTATYTLTALGQDGPVTAQVTVTVTQPDYVSIDSFTASPSSIAPGGTSTLTWATTNATSASIDNSIGTVNVNGSTAVTPSQTTTYTLTAEGEGGPVTERVTVTVIDPTAVHMKINSGANSYDVSGWERDDAYVSAGADFVWSQGTDTSGEPDAAPADVYMSVRHQEHSYSFPDVPDGTYEVRIHFVEGGIGPNRAMNYTIEGVRVLENFQITSEVAKWEALVKKFVITVSDGDGLQIVCEKGSGNDVFEAGIEIISTTADPVNDPPTATILANPVTGGAPLAVDFQGVGVDTDGQVVSYQWDFGDGGTSTEQSLSHTYTSPGYYDVTLTVTDDDGATGQETLTVTVMGITLLSPNGGEVWYVGTTQLIEWTTSLVDNVVILYSTDNGSSWQELAASVYESDTEWGAYPWVVPDSPSTECLIHIDGYTLPVSAESADTFEIKAVADTDGDGMDDAWEIRYFGDLTHDGTVDTDGDGFTDLEEFMAGSDPTVDETGAGNGGGSTGLGCAPTSGAARGAAAAILLLVQALGIFGIRRRVAGAFSDRA